MISSEKLEGVFHELAKEGEVLMLLASTSFSEQFGWVADKYGISWQLNLEKRMN